MSAYSNSISWDEIDLGGEDYKLVIVGGTHPYLPEPRVQLEDLSQADGAVSFGATWGPRYFEFECVIAAESAEDRATCIANVITALRTTEEGEKPLVLGWEPDDVYQARLLSGINGRDAINGVSFPLRFVAPQPWPEDA